MIYIIFYTDGSCKSNPNGAGGYGVIQLEDDKYIKYHYSERCDSTTSNREELKALLHVLKYLLNQDINKDTNVIIYCDSAYTVNTCTNWMHNWYFKGWRKFNGELIENRDIIQELYNNYIKVFETCQVEVRKCKGHCGILGNELVDALAAGDTKKWDKLVKENGLEFAK